MIKTPEVSTEFYKMRWQELDAYVAKGKDLVPDLPIWKLIKSRPLDTLSLEQLVRSGWRIYWIPSLYNEGHCLYSNKEIVMGSYPDAYERDKTLLHELTHAWYGDSSVGNRDMLYSIEHAAVEWIARKCRNNPLLLRGAWSEFGLEPMIYDLASYKAAHPMAGDPNLPMTFPWEEARIRQHALSTLLMA